MVSHNFIGENKFQTKLTHNFIGESKVQTELTHIFIGENKFQTELSFRQTHWSGIYNMFLFALVFTIDYCTASQCTHDRVEIIRFFLYSTITALWANSVDEKLVIFFFFLPRKQNSVFHANYLQLQWRQFARNVESCFQGKMRKYNILQYVVCWKNFPRVLCVNLIIQKGRITETVQN